MAFPLSPSTGQTHTESGRSYVWTGTSWDLLKANAFAMTGTDTPAIVITNGNRIGTSAPLQGGDIYTNTATNQISFWNGANWVDLSSGAPAPAQPLTQGTVFAVTEDFSTGNQNTGLGWGALDTPGTGTYNTAVGIGCIDGQTITNGSSNTALGSFCLRQVQDADNNVAVGKNNGASIRTGQNNALVGTDLLSNVGNNTSSYNLLLGASAGSDIDGVMSNNTIVGTYKGSAGAGLSDHIVLARNSSTSNIGLIINDTNAFGIPSGNTPTNTIDYGTSGQALISQGSTSAPVWANVSAPLAVVAGTSGSVFGGTMIGVPFTIALGYGHSPSITGVYNTLIGSDTGADITTGTYNTCLGFMAGFDLNQGNYNTLIGNEAGRALVSTDKCTLVGKYDGSGVANSTTVLSDGDGFIKFWANSAGAWAAPTNTGATPTDYGTPGYILTSQGSTNPPIWAATVIDLFQDSVQSVTASSSAIGIGGVDPSATELVYEFFGLRDSALDELYLRLGSGGGFTPLSTLIYHYNATWNADSTFYSGGTSSLSPEIKLTFPTGGFSSGPMSGRFVFKKNNNSNHVTVTGSYSWTDAFSTVGQIFGHVSLPSALDSIWIVGPSGTVNPITSNSITPYVSISYR